MEFERVLDRLATSVELLRLAQLATIFDSQKSTVDSWRKAYGFPEHVKLAPDLKTGTRYWRPDLVAEWVRARAVVDQRGADVDEVCAIVGMHHETWYDWVRANRAPAHKWLAFGTGHHLWDREEVRTWLHDRTGGYSLPRELRAPRAARAHGDRTPPARTPRGRKRKSEVDESESRA